MEKIIGFLKGKKTYILAIIGGIVFVASRLGYIEPNLENQAYTILGVSGFATIRDGINTTNK